MVSTISDGIVGQVVVDAVHVSRIGEDLKVNRWKKVVRKTRNNVLLRLQCVCAQVAVCALK